MVIVILGTLALAGTIGWKFSISPDRVHQTSPGVSSTPSTEFKVFESKLKACMEPRVDINCAKSAYYEYFDSGVEKIEHADPKAQVKWLSDAFQIENIISQMDHSFPSRVFEKAKALKRVYPKSEDVSAQMVFLLSFKAGDPEAARREARTCLSLNPKNDYCLSFMAQPETRCEREKILGKTRIGVTKTFGSFDKSTSIVLRGKDLQTFAFDKAKSSVVFGVKIDGNAAERLANATRENVNQFLVLVYDDHPLEWMRITQPITGTAFEFNFAHFERTIDAMCM